MGVKPLHVVVFLISKLEGLKLKVLAYLLGIYRPGVAGAVLQTAS